MGDLAGRSGPALILPIPSPLIQPQLVFLLLYLLLKATLDYCAASDSLGLWDS